MCSTVVRYASAGDVVTYTSPSTVSNTETDAIVLLDTDVLATSVASVGGNTQGTLYMNFTIGSLTTVTIRLYGSYLSNPTATDWFIETEESSSSGVLTLNNVGIVLTATTTVPKMWHFPIGACKAYKITIQSSGTITSSSIFLAVALRSN